MRESRPSQNVDVARALGSGLTWALSTALFLYLGMLADGWLGSKPVFTLSGAFIGAAAGFYYVYDQLMRSNKKDKSDS